MSSRIKGFRDLSWNDRRKRVAEELDVDVGILNGFNSDALLITTASNMTENVVGVHALPVGVATNFTINGEDLLVPMVTEEASVVAAASNGARMSRMAGGFQTSSTPPLMQAQIQVVDVPDPAGAKFRILKQAEELCNLANSQDTKLLEVGGGVRDLEVRLVETRRGVYVVVHLTVDVGDAMGANAVNTMAEALAGRIEQIAGGNVVLRILTNLANKRLSRAQTVIASRDLGGSDVAKNMVHAYELAAADPYRAATHNKGIMNGVSAVVLATGNDTRAVEAGAHAFAATGSQGYSSLSTFELDEENNLIATLEMPMPVGILGGATKVHPGAQSALEMMRVSSAAHLAEIIVAVGLAQNIAALRVLASEGVQRGHMSLHAKNIAASVGADEKEVASVADILINERVFSHDRAASVLHELRQS